MRSCISYDIATTSIYTLSLHDALPISSGVRVRSRRPRRRMIWPPGTANAFTDPSSKTVTRNVYGTLGSGANRRRSEEHTSELQSHSDLVCRLLLEKKKKDTTHDYINTT